METAAAQATRSIALNSLHARRAELERVVNELELEIRMLCQKQSRVLSLVHAIEEVLATEPA